MFDLDIIKTLEDYQRSNFYYARVISLDDPLKLNRIKIHIFGLTDDFSDDAQPWCNLQFINNFITYPNKDDIIRIFFQNNNIFTPVYLGTIYGGVKLNNQEGLEKFYKNIQIKKENFISKRLNAGYSLENINFNDNLKKIFKKINNIDDDKEIFIQNTFNHFNILTPNLTWWRKFDNLEEVDTSQYSAGEYHWIRGRNPEYSQCPFKDKVFPWYQLNENNNPNEENDEDSWKNIYGGWKFFNEKDLKNGLIYFPDNFKSIYLKRYIKWVKWLIEATPPRVIFAADHNQYSNAVPKSWDFIPSSPSIYTDPELYSVAFFTNKEINNSTQLEGMQEYYLIKPFPFGKMKIKNRQYYKQSTWLSYDGKTAIELDDNDNYERLKLSFNFDESGLEFSKAGWNGLEIWSEGSLKMQFWGIQGSGKNKHGQYVNSSINFYNHDFYLNAKSVFLGGDESAFLIATGNNVGIRSKKGTALIIGGSGVTIQTEDGYSLREGERDTNAGIQFGSPLLLGTGGKEPLTGGLNGWIPILIDVGEEEATKFFKTFNQVLLLIKKLAEQASTVMTPAQAASTLATWGNLAKNLLRNLENSFSALSIMAANQTINIEGEARKK